MRNGISFAVICDLEFRLHTFQNNAFLHYALRFQAERRQSSYVEKSRVTTKLKALTQILITGSCFYLHLSTRFYFLQPKPTGSTLLLQVNLFK